MARAYSEAIEVEGLNDLRKAIRKLGDEDLKKALKIANKKAAEEVADRARQIVPKRTGRLEASIGTRGGQKEASVKAGSAARVPYAGPIHFGWPTRPNQARGWRGGPIRPQPFLYEALDDRRDAVRAAYDKAMADLAEKI